MIGTVHVPRFGGTSSLSPGNYEFLYLSKTHSTSEQGTPAVDMRPFQDDYVEISEASSFDLRELSRSWWGDQNPESQVEEEDSEWEDPMDISDFVRYDTKAFDPYKLWHLYNFMLVETKKGISRRVALGKVHIDGFLGEKPVFRDVNLE